MSLVIGYWSLVYGQGGFCTNVVLNSETRFPKPPLHLQIGYLPYFIRATLHPSVCASNCMNPGVIIAVNNDGSTQSVSENQLNL
ncbi:MAG: hypothetical protein RLP02_05505 [Coleofasciculus sp. C2-GNP5-27]